MTNRQHQIDRVNHIAELFVSNHRLFNTSAIPEIQAKGTSKVVASLPLKAHLNYGNTILFINELMDTDGSIKEYRYGWEFVSTPRNRKSKHERHITAFDKQEHPEPPHNNINTDPFHHHHVPGEIGRRKDTNVQSLEDVLSILTDYIQADIEYKATDSF